jgi:hypothetical protein
MISGIGRLLSLLAVMGLALLPIARPVMAAPAAIDHLVGHHQSTTLPTISVDHDCCPKDAPAFHCDGDCLAICAAQFICIAMQPGSLAQELELAAFLLPRNDAGLAGLKERPPPKPPKI